MAHQQAHAYGDQKGQQNENKSWTENPNPETKNQKNWKVPARTASLVIVSWSSGDRLGERERESGRESQWSRLDLLARAVRRDVTPKLTLRTEKWAELLQDSVVFYTLAPAGSRHIPS